MGGIKGLQTFLRKTQNCTNNFKNIPIDVKCIAIDAYNSLWKYIYSNTEEPLFCIFNQATTLMSIGIRPIYIIDGKPFDEKNNIIEKRRIKKRNKLDQKKVQLNNLIKIQKKNPTLNLKDIINTIQRSCRTLTPNLVSNFKKLLDLINVQYIQSDNEADYTIAKMYNLGLIDGCITDDMDFHLLGCYRIFHFEKNMIKPVIEYNHIYRKLNLTKQQFMDFCLLLGTDYHKKKIKLSIELIYHNIIKFKNLQEWIDNEEAEDIRIFLIDSLQIKKSIYSIIKDVNIDIPKYKIKNINIKKIKFFFENIINKNHKQYHLYNHFIKIIKNINFNNFIKMNI